MIAQPRNRFVFYVVVVEFAVNGNQALWILHLSLLYYDKRLFHFFFKSDYVICLQADLLFYFLLNERLCV